MLLTVFRTTRQHDQKQIDRAVRAQKACERDHRDAATGDLPKAGVMTGYHTRWVRRPEHAEDPERVAIREALAFGKAVYDQRCARGPRAGCDSLRSQRLRQGLTMLVVTGD